MKPRVRSSSRSSKILLKVPGTFSSFRIKAKIVSNAKIAPDYYKIDLHIGAVSSKIVPGQFFAVKCSDGLNPLLRRPFGVHRMSSRGSIEILYKVVGKATELLSKKKKGEMLDVIGPLGNGFPIKLSAKRYPLNAILVAGGHGVAPLVALAERLAYSVERIAFSVFIGAKTKSDIICDKDFKKIEAEIYVATEDGSKGHKGLVTDLLDKKLSAKRYPLNATVYACGPNPMLKAIAKIAGSKRLQAFGSFEEHMACGVGSCHGCAVKTKDGFRRVCKDGPVFDLRDIVW